MADYRDRFSKLKVNTSGGHASPHKPCLLLAIIDLAEAGSLSSNEIYYRPELIERFNDYFEIVRKDRDHPNVYMPFFHLRSEKFWHHEPMDGREAVLQAMKTAVRHGDISENIRCVRLDDELHQQLQDSSERQALRAVLITRWFGDKGEELWKAIRTHQTENAAEAELRSEVEGKVRQVRDEETPARSAAFRRLVLQAYDYRCAATGWRIIVPGGFSLVEAAHIVPFAESFNDDPRNGIALTPTFHVALDRNLIAPGPEMKWHVSPILDRRIPDNKPFVELEGQRVIFDGDERYRPSEQLLESRFAMLRGEES